MQCCLSKVESQRTEAAKAPGQRIPPLGHAGTKHTGQAAGPVDGQKERRGHFLQLQGSLAGL